MLLTDPAETPGGSLFLSEHMSPEIQTGTDSLFLTVFCACTYLLWLSGTGLKML